MAWRFSSLSDPLNYGVLADIQIETGMKVLANSATKEEIISSIDKYYGFTRTLEALGIKKLDEKEIKYNEAEDESKTPIVELVDTILANAVKARASDIHMDPLNANTTVRYRVDGTLSTVRDIPIQISHKEMKEISLDSRRSTLDSQTNSRIG